MFVISMLKENIAVTLLVVLCASLSFYSGCKKSEKLETVEEESAIAEEKVERFTVND